MADTEIAQMQRLESPYTVRLIGTFQNQDSMCIVLEFCQNGDLRKVIADLQKLPEAERLMKVWELLSQIALAANHLHSNNVIHRDIKPENIFVMEDGSVRLGDFGLLKDLTNQNYATVVGTKVYHAPEVFKQKRMTFESDVFAIGNIIFELLTGKHPFDAKTEQEIIQKIVRYDVAKLPLSISRDFNLLYYLSFVLVCN
ncbi:MAG: putative protein kinase,serine/threonine-protein kinase [Streblomastix strix]|uniref:non-specific serine/threonine protein kinase n=1 Tax=Streblomastix strix TaxID=222440 RepID=A0A5J4UEC1_9EUKA|nr:MAG: putative protein kinase,serine/threonine-protein kinase [Streblomastix strix]